jgi:hypothetical protein
VLIKAVVKVEPLNIRRPKWKGTAAILKNIPIVTSIIPGNQIVIQQIVIIRISITSKLPIARISSRYQKYNS